MVDPLPWSVTAGEFEAFVTHHRQRLALIHFWADWNPLDPGMFTVFDEIEQTMGDQVAMARVQVGPVENQELCRWLGIIQVPTVLYVFRNQIIDVKVGYANHRLVNHVQTLLQGCLAAGPEHLGLAPLLAQGSPAVLGAPTAPLAPGFGPGSMDLPGRPTEPLGSAGGPMRFGLRVGKPVAPVVVERQKKSWLSRWLGME